MGDRANIVIEVEGQAPLYLYTHWDGYRVEQLAANGLREAMNGGRLSDEVYAARIITDVFLAAHADQKHTGAGISTFPTDGMDHLVKIGLPDGTVDLAGQSFTAAEFVDRYESGSRS